ncbi:MAG: methyltransferase domain-containing protein [Rhodospirillales bacterium]|nr:methyltransferase domain-containing protein [Rhodospirillales bacterium]
MNIFGRQTAAAGNVPDAVAPSETPSEASPAEGGGTPGRLRARFDAWWAAQAPRRAQLRAWWDGYYLPEEPAPEVAAPAAAPSSPAPKLEVADRWSASRVKISELIWGDGFSFPGGTEHVLEMVKPLGLNKEKSMLDLGCGLGGATRAISKTFGAWVLGMESSKNLAVAGAKASEMAGLSKKAPVEHFDPVTVELPAKKYDAVFARQSMFHLANKKRLLTEIEKCLKPGGQLMFTDFVLSKAGANSPALAKWMAAEDHAPVLCTLDQFTKELRALKLDVRVADDMSTEFRKLVLDGWANLARILKPDSMNPEESKSLVREVELWGLRVAAIDSGELRLARFYGLKRG